MEFKESSISQSLEDQCVCLNSSNCMLFCSLCDWNLLLVACLHKEYIKSSSTNATSKQCTLAMENICGDPQGLQNMYSTPGHHGLIFGSASRTSHGAISYSQAVLVQDCTNSYKFHFMPLALHPKIVGLCFLDGKPKGKNFHVIPVAAG